MEELSQLQRTRWTIAQCHTRGLANSASSCGRQRQAKARFITATRQPIVQRANRNISEQCRQGVIHCNSCFGPAPGRSGITSSPPSASAASRSWETLGCEASCWDFAALLVAAMPAGRPFCRGLGVTWNGCSTAGSFRLAAGGRGSSAACREDWQVRKGAVSEPLSAGAASVSAGAASRGIAAAGANPSEGAGTSPFPASRRRTTSRKRRGTCSSWACACADKKWQ